MSLITITINNKNFQLSCNEGAEKELYGLTDHLNKRINEVKTASPNASFELILVMTALSLQNDLQGLRDNLFDDEENSRIGKDEEKFSETLSTIAGYLENLAQKLNKYK